MNNSLQDFSLDGGDFNLFEFEGEDYKKNKKLKFINLPQRERKQNYNENDYYRSVMGDAAEYKKESSLRRLKAVGMPRGNLRCRKCLIISFTKKPGLLVIRPRIRTGA